MDAPFGAWEIAGTYTWIVLDERTWRRVAGPYRLRREATAEALRRNLGRAPHLREAGSPPR